MSKIEVTKHTLKHQTAFAQSPYKYPALIGGLGSGKTDAGIARILTQKYKYPQLNQAYYMPDYSLIRDRAIPGFEEELTKIGQPYKLNKSDKIITLENKGMIFFRSMDNPASIVSYEVADSVVDELDTLKPDKAKHVHKKIRERNRSKKPDGMPNTIGNITTPDQGTAGEIYRVYGKCINKDTINNGDYELLNNGIVGDYHLIEAATADNPFLPHDYLNDLLEMYDPILANLYTRGKMVSLNQDKVYHFFNRQKHHINRTMQPNEPLHIGLDFNVGGCAGIVYIREADKLIAVDEFVSRNTHEIAININARYVNHQLTLYPDSSGGNESSNASKSDIQILKDMVRTPNMPIINAPSINGAIRDRVNSTNALLSKSRMLVNTIKCPRFTNALEAQGWDKNGKPEKSDEHAGGAIDDWNDAGTYVIARIYPVVRNTFTVSQRN
jgi:PBSX family phage terminase large subunit